MFMICLLASKQSILRIHTWTYLLIGNEVWGKRGIELEKTMVQGKMAWRGANPVGSVIVPFGQVV